MHIPGALPTTKPPAQPKPRLRALGMRHEVLGTRDTPLPNAFPYKPKTHKKIWRKFPRLKPRLR